METRYWYSSPLRLTPPEPPSKMGGEMTVKAQYMANAILLALVDSDSPPANMARACCNPRIKANTTGTRSSSPKKGAVLRVCLVKGIRGVKR